MNQKEEDRWSWTVMQYDKHLHVLPTDEIDDHFPDNCPCKPKGKEVENGFWMWTHVSYDGRREEVEKLIYKDKMGRTIYQGKRVHKHWDNDASNDKSDMNYMSWDQRAEVINPFRLFLEDVSTWEVYSDPYEPFNIQKTKQVLEVEVCTAGGRETCYIVEDLEVFDHLIEQLYDNNEKS